MLKLADTGERVFGPRKEPKIPTHGEERERALRDFIRRGRKPVVLIVDEAHDLHSKTLAGLKRLMEVVADGGGTRAIILAGHPKLRNDLRRLTMEEIGYRSVLSRQLDDLEPRLTQHGHSVKNLADRCMRSPPRSGCSCAALWMPNARTSYPSRCA